MEKINFFRKTILDFLQHSIIKGKKLLIIGGNIGEEVIRLKPAFSVELFDLKGEAEVLPTSRNPNIIFREGSIGNFQTQELFDYIIFYSNLNYEDDLYYIFARLKKIMHRDSKVFIIEINPFILFILKFLKNFGFVSAKLETNMLSLDQLENLINIFGFDILDRGYRFAIPFNCLGIGSIVNAVLPRIKGLRNFCFGQYIAFRLHPLESAPQHLSCSIVVPCYNEESNLEYCISRIPKFGLWREIIIVNDGSTDKTEEIAHSLIKDRKDIRLISYAKNQGKGYAVKNAWQQAKGDVLMMLDCDYTTPPEELVLFHDAMEKGAEFINGTRIVYPREKNSIPRLNRMGVYLFAKFISWITQKRISDTFCGTKVLLRKHLKCFDIEEFLWGDWDLFFAAARYRMKMSELPVHYKARRHGKTKMKPIKHGIILFFKAFEGLKIIK